MTQFKTLFDIDQSQQNTKNMQEQQKSIPSTNVNGIICKQSK